MISYAIPALSYHASSSEASLRAAARRICVRLQVLVVLIWQRHGRSFVHLFLVHVESGLVDSNFGRSKSRSSDKLELGVADEFSSEPQEGLFEVVVGLCRDVVVLQVLLAVEGDGLCLHFSLLDIDFVAAQDDGDVLADANDVTWNSLAIWPVVLECVVPTMPIGDVLVCDSGCDIEHDDGALAVDVITVS